MREELTFPESATVFLQLRCHLIYRDHFFVKQVLKGEMFKFQNAEQFRELSGREIEVLQLLARGLNNPMIAKKLLISRSTVETHRKHLKRKLNLKSYCRLVKYAFAFDLIDY